jgi:uncharacterized protein with ATP-grasp and redox domains
MKLAEQCFDCLLSRVSLECSLCGADAEKSRRIREECSRILQELWDQPMSHPQMASRLHRTAYGMLGTYDPFDELKREGNATAIAVCREVRPSLSTFRDFVHAAVIANIFDYGVKGHSVASDFSAFFKEEFNRKLTVDDTEKIAALCYRVVYLSDNCGEIVFDRLLIECLKKMGSHVTLAVRDAPMLNDATLEDARMLGLDRIADLLTTVGGGAEIGICMENIPDDLRDAIDRCTIIIAKGMANYESLSEMHNLPPVAYLLAAKCKPVADDIGVPVGARIALLRV